MTTTAQDITVLKLYANGRPADFIATATQLPINRVQAIATEHGWPDQAKMAEALAELTREAAPRVPVREDDTRTLRVVADPIPAAVSTPAVRRDQGTTAARPTPAPPAAPGPSVDELVRACARSESKRTQARGVKLAALVDDIRAALRAERETAEAKAAREKARAAAVAEVKRLEKALAEARAKAVAAGAPGGERGGPRPCPECGDQLASPQALGAHRRHKHGIAGGQA